MPTYYTGPGSPSGITAGTIDGPQQGGLQEDERIRRRRLWPFMAGAAGSGGSTWYPPKWPPPADGSGFDPGRYISNTPITGPPGDPGYRIVNPPPGMPVIDNVGPPTWTGGQPGYGGTTVEWPPGTTFPPPGLRGKAQVPGHPIIKGPSGMGLPVQTGYPNEQIPPPGWAPPPGYRPAFTPGYSSDGWGGSTAPPSNLPVPVGGGSSYPGGSTLPPRYLPVPYEGGPGLVEVGPGGMTINNPPYRMGGPWPSFGEGLPWGPVLPYGPVPDWQGWEWEEYRRHEEENSRRYGNLGRKHVPYPPPPFPDPHPPQPTYGGHTIDWWKRRLHPRGEHIAPWL